MFELNEIDISNLKEGRLVKNFLYFTPNNCEYWEKVENNDLQFYLRGKAPKLEKYKIIKYFFEKSEKPVNYPLGSYSQINMSGIERDLVHIPLNSCLKTGMIRYLVKSLGRKSVLNNRN